MFAHVWNKFKQVITESKLWYAMCIVNQQEFLTFPKFIWSGTIFSTFEELVVWQNPLASAAMEFYISSEDGDQENLGVRFLAAICKKESKVG